VTVHNSLPARPVIHNGVTDFSVKRIWHQICTMTTLVQSHDSSIQAAGKTLRELIGSFGFYPENSLIIRWLRKGEVVLTQRCDIAAFVSPEGLSQSDLEIYLEPGRTYSAEKAVIVVCLENLNPSIHSVVGTIESSMVHANIDVAQVFVVVGQRIFSRDCFDDCQPHFTPMDMAVSRLAREAQCASNSAQYIEVKEFPELPEPERVVAWRASESQFVTDLMRRAGHPFVVAELARLIVALGDIRVRDSILWDMANGAFDRRLLANFLTELLPKLDSERGAPVATTAAICWWLNGNGAMANLCINRAVTDAPSYSLAIMVRAALEHALPPGFWLESVNELTREQCLAGLDVAL
jgi:hypothetical protein